MVVVVVVEVDVVVTFVAGVVKPVTITYTISECPTPSITVIVVLPGLTPVIVPSVSTSATDSSDDKKL